MAKAELKYDLALISTMTDKKIRLQPWYKERLRTKQFKSLKTTDAARSLVGKDWLFLKDGLDDFRDGLPPENSTDIFLRGSKGPGPNITNSENMSSVKQPAAQRRFDKNQICFSHVSPLQQQKREHIDEIEFGLLQHPLALYPHLEESVPEDLFDDIVDVLEPDLHVDDEEETVPEEVRLASPSMEAPSKVVTGRDSVDARREDILHILQGEDGPVRNPYRWLPRKDEKDQKAKKKGFDRRSNSPSQEEHIKTVTKQFCDWVANLGGESNNVEESTIMSLFASGYETKPALSVPIHVVELSNVPPELRISARIQSQPSDTKVQPAVMTTSPRWNAGGSYEPSWVKFKYGAYYLNPKMWKKRDANVPLVDPKELKALEMTDAKRRSKNMNQELASTHGSKAFLEFMDRKGCRKPEFLVEVAEIQRLADEEEQKRTAAEQSAENRGSFGSEIDKSVISK